MAIKILPLTPPFKSKHGGINTYCQNLIDLFSGNKEIVFENIHFPKYINLPLFNKRWYNWRSLYKQVKKSNCDVAFINGYAEFVVWQQFIIAKALKKKIVYAPHFHPFEFLDRPLLGKLFFSVAIRPLLRWASAIVTISKSDYNYFENLKGVKNLYMVPHHFVKDTIADGEITKKRKDMILFVGRNEDNKGMEYLYKIPKKFEVHCVTGGNLQRKDFIQHQRIPAEELNQLYREAALVVIPSRYEAFSYVALEAFTNGTPVLMSSNVKIAEYLDNEKGYSVFSYGDFDDFISKIEKTMGMSVDIELILSKFNPDKIKRKYIEVFRSVF